MYKLKALHTFRHRNKKMIRQGKIFDEKDNRYAKALVDYKLVEVIAIIKEKSKEVIKVIKKKAKVIYKKKIVEPETNKEVEAKEHEGYGEKMEGIKVETGEVGILEESTEKKKEKIVEPITTDQFKTKKRRKKIIKRSKW